MYDNTLINVLKQIYIQPGIHKRELSNKLKLGMPSIDYALKKIDTLLKKKKSGNQINFYLDYSKISLIPLLYHVEYSRFEKLPPKVKFTINEFLKELKDKPIITIIFGSYAKENYTKISDIDILLVFQKIDNSKDIENAAKKVSMRHNTNLQPVYLDYNSFRESFFNSTKEFFKNLKKDKIIVSGIEWWVFLKNEEA